MSNRAASNTALATAYLRAAHQLLDNKPLILEDTAVIRLLGPGTEQRIVGAFERYQQPEAIALRAHLVLRSRFAEDRLAAAVERGIAQYVVVGAGFDTFALRQPEWAKSLKVIEVDHLGTQTEKRSRISQAGLELPPNVVLADIDFERESLQDGLRRNGVATDVPTFFSWLGVTMYLTEPAIDATLRSMAAFPAGSEVVVTFLQPPSQSSDVSMAASAELARHVAAAGEPFVSYFEEDAFDAKLQAAGFSQIEFLTPEKAGSRYFGAGLSDLPKPRRTGIVAAIR